MKGSILKKGDSLATETKLSSWVNINIEAIKKQKVFYFVLFY